MSKNFYTFQRYYKSGLWSIERLRAVVGKPGGITKREFEMIVGTVPSQSA